MNATETIRFIIPVFCLATMFSMGLDLKLDDVLAPFRHWLAAAIIALTNNVLVPLLAIVILAIPTVLPANIAATVKEVMGLSATEQIGFLLVALAAGGVLAPTLVSLAKANVPLTKCTTILLVLATVILMPVEIGLLGQANQFGANTVSAGAVFATLLLYQLLPFVLGVAIKTWYSAIALLLRPLISQLASLLFPLLLLLLPMTNQGPFTLPTQLPTEELGLFSTAIPASDLAKGPASANLINIFKEKGVTISDKSQISGNGTDQWLVTDGSKQYNISSETASKSVTQIMPFLFTMQLGADSTLIDALNEGGKAPDELQQAFKAHKVELGENTQITTTAPGPAWKTIEGDKTYLIKAKGATLNIYSETVEATNISIDVLKLVQGQLTLATVLDLLKQFSIAIGPIVVYGAVAALLLYIGYYAGLLVNNATGAKNTNTARTQAISAGVRNVGAALIVAANHFTNGSTDIHAIAIVLVFYTISLIVTAIQADKWSRQPETVPTAQASLTPTAVGAPGRGVTSTS